MSQNLWIKGVVAVGSAVSLSLVVTTSTLAAPSWSAPAPMGPYGGHFDFGVPEKRTAGEPTDVEATYAVYQQQGKLPVINASYRQQEHVVDSAAYSDEELARIDPAWSLGDQSMVELPQGVNGAGQQSDVWALGEIQPEKLPALLDQPEAVVESQSTQEAALQPCRVEEPVRLTSAQTPFQEAVLDEFEQSDLDMDAMGREADVLAQTEERQNRRWAQRPAPVFYPTFMPDYALGVRRADVMDPLAMIPQMAKPVQYFGFNHQQ